MPNLTQARYAIAIAEGADAERLARPEYEKAAQLLTQASAAAADKKYAVRNTAPQLARSAVQAAEDARRSAVIALAAEQKAAAAKAAREEAERKAAVEATAAAEAAKLREATAVDEASLAANRAARADLVARLNRVLPTRETSRGIVAEIAGVQFAVGAATLNADAKVALARFAGIVGIYRVDAVPGGRTHGHDRERRDQSRALARAGELRCAITSRPRVSRRSAFPSSDSARTSRSPTTRRRRGGRGTGAWRSS